MKSEDCFNNQQLEPSTKKNVKKLKRFSSHLKSKGHPTLLQELPKKFQATLAKMITLQQPSFTK